LRDRALKPSFLSPFPSSLVAQLYEQFVSNFEGRLSQLQFVLILTQVATQYYPSRPVSVPGEHERL
jgi:hypothetical protein